MRTILKAVVFSLTLGLAAYADVYDFESISLGTYTTLALGGTGSPVVTYTGGNLQFDVANSGNPGPPISGHALVSYFQNANNMAPFQVNFTPGVTSVQIGAGDFDADVDPIFLQAFDALNNLIGSDSATIPDTTFGGLNLSVNPGTNIAYVRFWSGNPFPGSVYWDNMITNGGAVGNVPEPTSLLLLGTAAGTLWLRIRGKKIA